MIDGITKGYLEYSEIGFYEEDDKFYIEYDTGELNFIFLTCYNTFTEIGVESINFNTAEDARTYKRILLENS